MNAPSRGEGGAFIRRGRLKEGGVYLFFFISRGAFIRGFTVCERHSKLLKSSIGLGFLKTQHKDIREICNENEQEIS